MRTGDFSKKDHQNRGSSWKATCSSKKSNVLENAYVFLLSHIQTPVMPSLELCCGHWPRGNDSHFPPVCPIYDLSFWNTRLHTIKTVASGVLVRIRSKELSEAVSSVLKPKTAEQETASWESLCLLHGLSNNKLLMSELVTRESCQVGLLFKSGKGQSRLTEQAEQRVE